MILKRIAGAVVICCVLLSGCTATGGKNFNEQAVHSLKPGITTYNEAITQIGTPTQLINNADSTVVQWLFVESNGFTLETKTKNLVVLFDKSGKMIRVQTMQGIDVTNL